MKHYLENELKVELEGQRIMAEAKLSKIEKEFQEKSEARFKQVLVKVDEIDKV